MQSGTDRSQGGDATSPGQAGKSVTKREWVAFRPPQILLVLLLYPHNPAAREAFQHQIHDEIDFQIEIPPSPYVTFQIFERYIDTVLILRVEAKRK
jgi:hypothetical protein